MQKDKKRSKLKLERQSVRVLTPTEIKEVRGGARRTGNSCCDLDTELLNPFTDE